MPRRVAVPILAACVVVLLWVTVPPDIIRFLLRNPIVLTRDLISVIRRTFAPAPRPLPTGSPFADIPGSEAESGIGPASTPAGAAPAGVQPTSPSAPGTGATSTDEPTDASQSSLPAPSVTSQDSPEEVEPEDSSPALETELPEVDVSPVEEVVEDLGNTVEETLPGVSAPEVPETELPGLSEVEPSELEPSELPGDNELPEPGDLPDPTEPLPDVELPKLP